MATPTRGCLINIVNFNCDARANYTLIQNILFETAYLTLSIIETIRLIFRSIQSQVLLFPHLNIFQIPFAEICVI